MKCKRCISQKGMEDLRALMSFLLNCVSLVYKALLRPKGISWTALGTVLSGPGNAYMLDWTLWPIQLQACV